MKKRISHIIFLPLLLLWFIGCENNACLHGTGETKTELYEFDSIGVINIYCMSEVELISDSVYFVEVEGGNEVLKYIEVKANGADLEFHDGNRCFWMRDYDLVKFRVHYPALKTMNVGEPCRIFSKQPLTDGFLLAVQADISEVDLWLDCKSFWFYTHKSTSGVYHFKGQVDNCVLQGYYLSVVDANDLKCRDLRVDNHSIADHTVFVTERITAGIYDRGNIFYKGNPEIVIDTMSGNGRLIQVEEE